MVCALAINAAERSLDVVFRTRHAQGAPATGERVGLAVEDFAVVVAFCAPPRRVTAADAFRLVKARVERVPVGIGMRRIHSPPTWFHHGEPRGGSFVAQSSFEAVYTGER